MPASPLQAKYEAAAWRWKLDVASRRETGGLALYRGDNPKALANECTINKQVLVLWLALTGLDLFLPRRWDILTHLLSSVTTVLFFACSHFHFVSKMFFSPPREQMHVLLLKWTHVVFQNLEKKKECWERLLDNLREDGGSALSGQKDPIKAHQMIRSEAILVLIALQKVHFYYRPHPVISPSLNPLSKWLLNLPQSTLNMAMFVPSEWDLCLIYWNKRKS